MNLGSCTSLYSGETYKVRKYTTLASEPSQCFQGASQEFSTFVAWRLSGLMIAEHSHGGV